MIRGLVRTVRLGIKSLLLHKLRSALTMLGLLFGVSAVIGMLAIGEGASREALERIKALGSTNILVRSTKPPDNANQSSMSMWTALTYGLTYRDAERLKVALATAEKIVQVRETKSDMRADAHWMSSVAVGTEPDFLDVVGMRVHEGRWISAVDMMRKANVCVLGGQAAQTLFPLEDPLGETIRIDNDRYSVVGVLEELGRSSGSVGPPLDMCVFIPMSTSQSRIGEETTRISGGSTTRERVELNEIKIKLRSIEDVMPAANVVRTSLTDNHVDQSDVVVTVPLELLREAEESKEKWNFMMGCMAGISLLVGGIGIMNVMLATVTERTREIGIRRALGAKKAHVVQQFIVETGVLSGIGGLLGVIVGWRVPYDVITPLFKEPTIVLVPHVLLAFGISFVVGVVFGLYPAWRAANMDPVEALRHE
ncbi:MAG: ABC transporter permease [Planctomycetes bacterium]|nr:ABC transporter permease [Planctomycetota bacterium]